jgi:hypothetical protein
MLELYAAGQSTRILKYLCIQNVRMVAWEVFYLCTVKQTHLYEEILDQTVLNILTGDMAELESIRA